MQRAQRGWHYWQPARRSAGAGAPTQPATPRRSSPRNGDTLAAVETGPLYAVVDEDDADHERCREALARAELGLIVPAL